MKIKYLIHWIVIKSYVDYFRDEDLTEIDNFKVIDLTDLELDEFVKDKKVVNVTFICIVKN